MGRHADDDRGRGFAGWLVGAAIAAVVLIIAIVAYTVVLKKADSAAAGACSSDVTLAVLTGPGAAPALAQAAGAYNKTKPVVRSACITAVVTTASDTAVLNGLTGTWPIKELPAPGMWVPDSTASLSALDAARPDLAAGHATDPFAWSPTVLAMRADDAAAVGKLAWSDLADAAGPSGSVSLPDGKHLILALPAIAQTRASSYALQSVVASAGDEAAVDDAAITANTALLQAIDAGHGGKAETTGAALAELASAQHSAGGSTVTAVPVVEADLVRFDRQATSERLTAVYPSGATVGDALIAAPLSATWTGRTITAAGSDFQAFLTSVAGQQVLADHGWRTTSAHAADPPAEVDLLAPVTMVPAGGPTVDHAIAVALGQAKPTVTSTPSSSVTSSTSPTTAPSTQTTTTPPSTTSTPPSSTETAPPPELATDGPLLTVIVDVSAGMGTDDAGKSLITWVQQALPVLFDGSVTDQIGMWAYSDGAIYPPTGSPELVPTGPITEDAEVPKLGENGAVAETVTELRSTALAEAIEALHADGERWAYGALMEALPTIASASIDGRDNRVLLITSGVDETPGTLRRQVLEAVEAEAGSLRLDVVGLGDAVPVDAYTDIAGAAHGEYIPVTDPATLGQQLKDFLTLGD